MRLSVFARRPSGRVGPGTVPERRAASNPGLAFAYLLARTKCAFLHECAGGLAKVTPLSISCNRIFDFAYAFSQKRPITHIFQIMISLQPPLHYFIC